MKKIIISVFTIGIVAAIAFGVTSSFFSDKEKSTGNTFTAGELDLRFQTDGVAAPFADVNGAALFSGVNVFNGDLKPGDKGEKTVKLWVDDNPACGNITVDLTEDFDNTCTEPEIGDEAACATSPTGTEAGSGELNDAVNFAVWADPNCNNVLDGAETILTAGTLTADKTYNIGELPITQANAQCYGIAYCFGTWNGTTCDGSLVNNASQTDSFKADIIINALQKRNQFDAGCPVDFNQGPIETTRTISLENKNSDWQILSNDLTSGFITYSHNDTTFHGTVTGTGLVAGGKYQITLNGPNTGTYAGCSFTNLSLGNFVDNNAFQGGFWNSAYPNLSLTCTANDEEGLYNMNLIGDHYTFIADGAGAFNYPFDLALPAGDYHGVKVLVKKMLDTHVSPWADTGAGYPAFNLYETASIDFTVL